MTDSTPPRAAYHPPGYDEEDPYEDVDLDALPKWWRRSVEEFNAHDMRPYRPPRFADGELTPGIVGDLESELEVTIRLRSIDPQSGNDWEIRVNGDCIGTVRRTREAGGYSEYHLDAERFEELIRSAARG